MGQKLSIRVRSRRRDAKLTASQIRAAWTMYQSGLSTYAIADLIWARFGFSSPRRCRTALHYAFVSDGRQLRDRAEAASLYLTRQLAPATERAS